ncbi:hypothetical protein FOI42_RS02840 [Escherichia coli]|nr:hypothetical protein [Escherichia coli]HCQ0858744.1 hypothetical protein [Escherichia coli]
MNDYMYELNLVSFIVSGLGWMYYMLGYILLFFRYNTFYKRYWDDAPIHFFAFVFLTMAVGEVLLTGIQSTGGMMCTLTTFFVVFGTVVWFFAWGLFSLIMKLEKLRDKLPER